MKIFISSTSYDLQDYRDKAIQIITKAGHNCIAFEEPDFPTNPSMHSHDECIEAVKNVDLVLCLIDKRYGGKYHGAHPEQFSDIKMDILGCTQDGQTHLFHKIIESKNLSITWCELITAQNNNIPIFTLARQSVINEKETRRHNQFFNEFKPAFVEKEEVFDLLDWITKNKNSNWIAPFHALRDFEEYLKKCIESIEVNYSNNENSVPIKIDNKTNLKDVKKLSTPVLFIVEGETDRQFISLLLNKINSHIEARYLVTYGKYRMFSNSLNYVTSMGDIKHTFIIYDIDDDDNETISLQNAIVNKLNDKCRTYVYPINPEIETWIKAGLKDRRVSRKQIRKIDLDIEFNIEQARKTNKQLNDFIEQILVIQEDL